MRNLDGKMWVLEFINTMSAWDKISNFYNFPDLETWSKWLFSPLAQPVPLWFKAEADCQQCWWRNDSIPLAGHSVRRGSAKGKWTLQFSNIFSIPYYYSISQGWSGKFLAHHFAFSFSDLVFLPGWVLLLRKVFLVFQILKPERKTMLKNFKTGERLDGYLQCKCSTWKHFHFCLVLKDRLWHWLVEACTALLQSVLAIKLANNLVE